MSIELIIVLVLLLVAVVLFATEVVSFDVTAILLMSALILSGILTLEEGLSGFSSIATVTIGAMFVISEGVRRSGALEVVGGLFTRIGQHSQRLAVFLMLLVISGTSAFVNSTATVALFIPVVISVSQELRISPSKLLMPLSFAAMFGGVCTLIGTSSNILVSSIAVRRGLEPFSMFEFAPLGIVFLVVGLTYLFVVGIRLIPERRKGAELTSDYEMEGYLADVVVQPGFHGIGHALNETDLMRDLDLDVLHIFHDDEASTLSPPYVQLRAGDVLRLRGGAGEIEKLLERDDLSLRHTQEWHDVDLRRGPMKLVEAVIAPNGPLAGRTIEDVHFYERIGAIPLALRHAGHLQQDHLGDIKLSGGDSVLLAIEDDRFDQIRRTPAFVLTSEVRVSTYRRAKMPLAVGILFSVVAAVALGLAPIAAAATTGGVAMILAGCLTTEEAYQSINWKIIFLLAGVIPLGIAMDKTGAATLMAEGILSTLGTFGPRAVIAGLFFMTMVLTNIISNQATAALLAPLAIQMADAMGANAYPFLFAITYSASLSFSTPFGYQTNLLVYGPGQYRFTDFTRVGLPLNLLLWVLATLLIPMVWPLFD